MGRACRSSDRLTRPAHDVADLLAHLASGHGTPGLFIIRRRAALVDVLAFLVEAAGAGDPEQWRDQVVFIP